MFYTKPWLDAAIILIVVLLFVGPKRLPALGKSLGHGMREFKVAITGKSQPDDAERAERFFEAVLQHTPESQVRRGILLASTIPVESPETELVPMVKVFVLFPAAIVTFAGT